MIEKNKLQRWSMLVATSMVSFHALGFEDNPDGPPSDGDTEVDDADDYIEPWVYVAVPDGGTFSMREVAIEGTPGWDAFLLFDLPIEHYEPVYVLSSDTSTSNVRVMVLMPSEHCLGDFNDDGTTDAGDLLLFVQAYVAQDIAADLTGNGVIDIFDQFLFFQLALMDCVLG